MTWNLNFGFPLIGFFVENGGEFANTKQDKLTSKLGLKVRFGPTFLLCSNGLNERNHASSDITIKKMMEDKKKPHTDTLVKAAAWTHNILVKKLGFSLSSVGDPESCISSWPDYWK